MAATPGPLLRRAREASPTPRSFSASLNLATLRSERLAYRRAIIRPRGIRSYQSLMYAGLSTLETLHKTICCIGPRLCIMLQVNFREFIF